MTTDGEQSIYLFFKNISTLGEVGAGRKGWRLRMEQALKTGDIYKHGTGISVGASQDANADVPARATTAAKQAMWDLDDACAINYMISKLPDNIAGQLLNLTAHQIWFHLMSNFDVGNTESIQSIFAAICWLKAKNLVLEAVDTFLVKHEEILSCAHQIDSPLVCSIPETASVVELSQYGMLNTSTRTSSLRVFPFSQTLSGRHGHPFSTSPTCQPSPLAMSSARSKPITTISVQSRHCREVSS
ncbi:hypothetical protein NBRC10512_007355 [Rhodotorula toruloides]